MSFGALAIRHTGIVVRNLESSIFFYCNLLGFEIKKQAEESGLFLDNVLSLKKVMVMTVKMSAKDGNLIELLYFKSHQKRRGKREVTSIGFTHIAFTVEDIDFEFKRLSKAGVKFNSPPQISSDGYAKLTFCKDPEGNLIELVQVLKK